MSLLLISVSLIVGYVSLALFILGLTLCIFGLVHLYRIDKAIDKCIKSLDKHVAELQEMN